MIDESSPVDLGHGDASALIASAHAQDAMLLAFESARVAECDVNYRIGVAMLLCDYAFCAGDGHPRPQARWMRLLDRKLHEGNFVGAGRALAKSLGEKVPKSVAAMHLAQLASAATAAPLREVQEQALAAMMRRAGACDATAT